MSSSEVESQHSPRSRYASAIRGALALSVTVVTMLAIPITLLGVLPTYRAHASFLVFYTPFLCLLTLCYLFYVRDSLARAMFGDLLRPLQALDPYYQETVGHHIKRGFRRLKAIVLGVLPAVFVILSGFCVTRYLRSLNYSVAAAAETYRHRSAGTQDVGMLQEEEGRVRPRRNADRPHTKVLPPAGVVPNDSLPAASDSVAVHRYVLRTTVIDDIPQLFELTGLYTGAFVSLLIAVSLMALKEYARDALGLSEHELVFGRYRQTDID